MKRLVVILGMVAAMVPASGAPAQSPAPAPLNGELPFA